MRLGVLDVGSNTIHLLVVDAHPGARPLPAATHKSVLRLMRYITDDGSISAEGEAAILEAIRSAVEVGEAEGIDELLPFATSAIREAANGPAILERIREETGVELQVLSGADEARLTFLAVRRWSGWSSGSLLLLDIGGGSLEIASGADEYPDTAVSLPLGAGRSTIGFLHDDPPTDEQLAALRDHARTTLAQAVEQFTGRGREHVIGTSKTIRSLARLAGSTTPGPGGTERSLLRRSELADWVPRLAQLPAEARTALPGITADRTFQIVAGGVVLREAMRALDVAELEVCPWALREGIILRYLDHLD
ncbi:Ppx/GppA phosphatase family protein [uncultured Leifsonia sp.]|uniref:Ppx/GppA phosphatase family protein n=1 Tax=uncultured Leifsonia sp. TaxID=340359 RepID=UPI0025FEC35D|nr:Ppx/GppA phosphatase family protein [uncultured Leifsonia sp.]